MALACWKSLADCRCCERYHQLTALDQPDESRVPCSESTGRNIYARDRSTTHHCRWKQNALEIATAGAQQQFAKMAQNPAAMAVFGTIARISFRQWQICPGAASTDAWCLKRPSTPQRRSRAVLPSYRAHERGCAPHSRHRQLLLWWKRGIELGAAHERKRRLQGDVVFGFAGHVGL